MRNFLVSLGNKPFDFGADLDYNTDTGIFTTAE